MRAVWAIALGAAVGIGLAVWLARDGSASNGQKRTRAERAAAAQAADAVPSLYRWRDDHGVLQITDQPPKGRKYERIAREGERAIAVDGSRE